MDHRRRPLAQATGEVGPHRAAESDPRHRRCCHIYGQNLARQCPTVSEMRPKALVVEDDAAARALLGQLLESLDCDVDLAADGEEALARLLAHDYDVVLLDIMLPRM